jgi:hypothetical protein
MRRQLAPVSSPGVGLRSLVLLTYFLITPNECVRSQNRITVKVVSNQSPLNSNCKWGGSKPPVNQVS